MARITATERNFWLNYFRQQIQATLQAYKRNHTQFLVVDLPAQAEAKANDKLGITTLIKSYTELDNQIAAKRKVHQAMQDKLSDKFNTDVKPLELKLEQLRAKRVAKVVDGSVSGWAKYTRSSNRQPYEYDQKRRDAESNAREELYDTSDEGKHVRKLEQQYRDAPVALMLATSRLEMANAVRALAVTIGLDLPAITSLEDLT